MSSGLVDLIKRAALDAEDNAKPTEIRYGKVISLTPLKVQITNQFILPESMLVVPEYLTDYHVKITLDGFTHDGIVHCALKLDDKVALLRQRGGQSYLILDRVSKGVEL